jgi:IclR family transcriptional regulator, mhp operon transcriptional activator
VQKPKVKTIRALSRGVDVLKQVQTSGGMSLNDLHHATLLPKATLLRILLTLQEKELVWQRMVDNAYLPSHVLQENVRRFDEETHLVEVASPLMERLTKTVKWPSILAVPRLGHMEVIEANAPRSYFHHIPLGPVGFQINMLRSATGRAYLAFCTDRECAAILNRLRASRRAGDRPAQDEATVAGILAHTRRLGYGARDPHFGGDFDRTRTEWNDGRDSIAVPIRVAAQVRGCLNLTWIQKVASRREVVQQHLKLLKDAADEIGSTLTSRLQL